MFRKAVLVLPILFSLACSFTSATIAETADGGSTDPGHAMYEQTVIYVASQNNLSDIVSLPMVLDMIQ